MILHLLEDKLLGAGRCDGCALFFSNNHGLVTLKQAEPKPANTSILMNESTANQSMHESFRQEVSNQVCLASKGEVF